MPTRAWTLSQNWVNLTFMHWEVEHHLLEKYIPEDLELERLMEKHTLVQFHLEWKT